MSKLKQNWPAIILAGMALGTAWAARGQFGHEHGASWAGGIGVLVVLLVANRKDWWAHALPTTLAGALAWGVSGAISYGIVIGYGRSTDPGNVFYGFLMLFFIGLLYGFVGGGVVGLCLTTFKDKKMPWHQLMVEMIAGGVLFYFMIVEQLSLLMTPPRHEIWAANFGMAAALCWFLIRVQAHSAMRVAIFSAIGAGFGFAFGNFLQTVGTVAEVKLHWWNVMEYLIGFGGGAGMAYGIFTSHWDEKKAPETKNYWKFGLTILLLVIPTLLWNERGEYSRLVKKFSDIDHSLLPDSIPYLVVIPFVVFAVHIAYWWIRFEREQQFTKANLSQLLYSHMLIYILLSLLITGSYFITEDNLHQYLYLVNFGVLVYYIPKVSSTFIPTETDWKGYRTAILGVIIVLFLLAIIASQSHEVDLSGAHRRFE